MRKRWALAILLAGVSVTLIAAYLAGSALSAPAHRAVGAAPKDLKALDVQFGGLKGWFVAAGESAPCVVLMHAMRTNRQGMIERARFLREAGYASLLFDFQAHGESPGEQITFGYRESANAQAAVSLLRDRFKCPRIAAVGQSMGGAAALVGGGPIEVDALVLESVYPSIEDAIAARLEMHLGSAGALLAPLLTLQIEPRLGIEPEQLRPVARIARFHRPVLVMAGSEDRHTPIEQARLLFAAANEPKAFWAVPGARHADLLGIAPETYRARLLAFLDKYIGPGHPEALEKVADVVR